MSISKDWCTLSERCSHKLIAVKLHSFQSSAVSNCIKVSNSTTLRHALSAMFNVGFFHLKFFPCLQRKLLKANFLLMRCGSTFLPLWLVLSSWARASVGFDNLRWTSFRLFPAQSGVLKECFSSLYESCLHSSRCLFSSSSSFLSSSSRDGYIKRFLIFECEWALALEGSSDEITLRCKRFFFGAHKMCWVKEGLSSIGGVACTVDGHLSIFFIVLRLRECTMLWFDEKFLQHDAYTRYVSSSMVTNEGDN